jgi:uncharacterized Zn-binding protein involved in type VI secretion
MPLIARLGDPGTHPGNISTSASRSKAEGILIARIGDTFDCELHGPNPITTGAVRSKCEGPLIAFHGSMTVCGASIIATATRTKVE